LRALINKQHNQASRVVAVLSFDHRSEHAASSARGAGLRFGTPEPRRGIFWGHQATFGLSRTRQVRHVLKLRGGGGLLSSFLAPKKNSGPKAAIAHLLAVCLHRTKSATGLGLLQLVFRFRAICHHEIGVCCASVGAAFLWAAHERIRCNIVANRWEWHANRRCNVTR
jgi:hypothetical protein